jgi:hypothetical protein
MCPVCSDEAIEARKAGRPLTTVGAGADAPFLLGSTWGTTPTATTADEARA